MPGILNKARKFFTRKVFGVKNNEKKPHIGAIKYVDPYEEWYVATFPQPKVHVNNSAVKVSSKTPSAKKTAKRKRQPNVNGAYFNPNTWNTFNPSGLIKLTDRKVKELIAKYPAMKDEIDEIYNNKELTPQEQIDELNEIIIYYMKASAKQELKERRANPSDKNKSNWTRRNNEVKNRKRREFNHERYHEFTSLAPVRNVPKAKTMENILRNMAPAATNIWNMAPAATNTRKSKALLKRLTRKVNNVKNKSWRRPLHLINDENNMAPFQMRRVGEGSYTQNLENIFNPTVKPEQKLNIGKLFNKVEANTLVRKGRAADLGHNFNVFGYEPKRGLWNNRSKLIKSPFENVENVAPAADPLASLPSNWNMYTKESKNLRAAQAREEIERKRQENNARRHKALVDPYLRRGATS